MTGSIADTTHLGGAPSTETTAPRRDPGTGQGACSRSGFTPQRQPDRVTLSEAAQLANVVRGLENALGRAVADAEAAATRDGPRAITPPPPTATLAPIRETSVPSTVRVEEVVILPTVYTNIGSLIDVFA